MTSHRRLPVSARHAFALAFDLAVRRDPVQSILVPLALQLPWLVLSLALPPLQAGSPASLVAGVLLRAGVLLALWITGVLISAMLRFRARSVFHSPADAVPEAPLECYGHGLRVVPALFCTEVLRAASFVVGGLLLVLPGLFLGFKFSMATEAVALRQERPEWVREMRALMLVLTIPVIATPLLTLVPALMVPGRTWIVWATVAALEALTIVLERRVLFSLLLAGAAIPALKRSFHLTESRWERWLEMIAISVMLIVPIWFLMTVCALLMPRTWNTWFMLGTWFTQASLLVIQYAWTFFYLRLEESDAVTSSAGGVRVPPAFGTAAFGGAGAPRLRLVELAPEDAGEGPSSN